MNNTPGALGSFLVFSTCFSFALVNQPPHTVRRHSVDFPQDWKRLTPASFDV